jgi:predicted DNA-binding WGR domain protein
MSRHCGKCGKTGHYAVTCKKTAKKSAKKSKGSIRRYRSTGSVTRSQRGRSFVGVGSGWLALHHGGSTGKTQHDKTWAVKVIKKGSGWAVVTRHGRRTGAKNETVRKATSSRAAAEKAASTLIRSKLRKGYYIVGGNR